MPLGLLFDLDGTVADTDPNHFEAFQTLLGEFGRELTHETFRTQVTGQTNATIMSSLFPDLGTAQHLALADRKEELFRTLSHSMEPLPGLLDLIAEAEAGGARICVVTNAPRLNAVHMLQSLGLGRLLPTIVVAEDLARGKPDPLPYRTGLQRLDCSADRAIAFEDSRAGIASATGAGITTVGLMTGLDTKALLDAGARIAARDYRDPVLLTMIRQALRGIPIKTAVQTAS